MRLKLKVIGNWDRAEIEVACFLLAVGSSVKRGQRCFQTLAPFKVHQADAMRHSLFGKNIVIHGRLLGSVDIQRTILRNPQITQISADSLSNNLCESA